MVGSATDIRRDAGAGPVVPVEALAAARLRTAVLQIISRELSRVRVFYIPIVVVNGRGILAGRHAGVNRHRSGPMRVVTGVAIAVVSRLAVPLTAIFLIVKASTVWWVVMTAVRLPAPWSQRRGGLGIVRATVITRPISVACWASGLGVGRCMRAWRLWSFRGGNNDWPGGGIRVRSMAPTVLSMA